MSDHSTYNSNALKCAEQVTLPLKTAIWKGQAGDFLGRNSGSSMDFQDHRNYVPGDDPRHINWQAYARTGTYTMKQYREEVRPTIDLILDISPSMFFEPSKERRSYELFYLIHAIAQRNGADISCHLISGSKYSPISSEAVATQQWVNQINEVEDADFQAAPALNLLNLRQSSIRVFISDLLFEGDPSSIIHPLASKQGKPIFLAPFLLQEANPNWQGNYDFIDAERGSKHAHKVDSATLKNYRKQYINHFNIWVQATQKFSSPFARVCSDHNLLEALRVEAIPNQALQLIHT